MQDPNNSQAISTQHYTNNKTVGCYWPQLLIIFLVYFAAISASTWMTPIDFDGAMHFQVAESLRDNFTYKSRYEPSKVYYPKITTNGPLQYFMASMISLFGLDKGRSLALGSVAGGAAVISFLYCWQSFILYSLLIVFWPIFFAAHTLFLGEVFTISMMMAGFMNWERWSQDAYIIARSTAIDRWKTILFSRNLLYSGLFFGCAISTKLFSAPSILLLLFCLAIDNYIISSDIKSLFKSPVVAVAIVVPYVIAIAIFILQFYVSTLHSGADTTTSFILFKEFIESHMRQSRIISLRNINHIAMLKYQLVIIVIYVMIFLFMLRKHMIMTIIIVASIVLTLWFNLNQRRIMPLTVPFMLISMRIIWKESIGEIIVKSNIINRYYLVAVAAIIMMTVDVLSSTPITIVNTMLRFSLKGAAHNVARISSKPGDRVYHNTLLPMLTRLTGPVFTSGWWQYPEISLRTGMIFYDRFAPENRQLLNNANQSFLLFSSNNQEDRLTERSLCGNILYRDGSLVLCRFSPH